MGATTVDSESAEVADEEPFVDSQPDNTAIVASDTRDSILNELELCSFKHSTFSPHRRLRHA